MAKSDKPEPKVLGKVGQLRVIEYTEGFPLLEIGKTVLGVRKLKDVLANEPAVKEFITRYDKGDKAKAGSPGDAAETKKLKDQLAELTARMAAMVSGKSAGDVPAGTSARLDPVPA